MKMTYAWKARIALVTALVCLFALSGCSQLRGKKKQSFSARYGNSGRSLALEIAQKFPFRGAGSPEEAAMADYLVAKLGEAGLKAEKQSFRYSAADGSQKDSQNVVARIAGTGFVKAEPNPDDPLQKSREMRAPDRLDGRQIIIGAHYDTKWTRAQAEAEDQKQKTAQVGEDGLPVQTDAGLPALTESDGIDDNAAAVAAVLTAARVFRSNPPAYDVVLVFFGAGHENYAGARAYASGMTEEQRSLTDAMINLDSVYAGDKVYAHAGQNSVLSGDKKDYALRRKLYECTDVYYDNLLLSTNGFALFTNQCGCMKELPGKGACVYREWTERKSDHTPFDELGLPIVFFDSADYALESCDDPVKESNDPYFSPVGGMVGGSAYDSSRRLTSYFVAESQLKDVGRFGTTQTTAPADEEEKTEEEIENYVENTDRLQIRINNLAFILIEVSQKAPPGTVAKGTDKP